MGEVIATFFVDLRAAVLFVFERRRFGFGFFCGWCAAFALNTSFVYILHNKGLLGNSVQNLLAGLGW